MPRPGRPRDKQPIESFWKTLAFEGSERKIVEYIEAFDFPLINSQVPKIKLVAANYNNMVAVSDDNIVFYYNADANSTEILELQNVDEVQSAAVGKDHIVLRCLNRENIEFYTYGDNSKNQLGVPDAEATAPVLALPLIEAADPVETMFEYQYKTLPYTNDGLKYSRHSLCAEVYV